MKRPLLWLGLGYIAGVAAAIVSKSDKSNLSLSDVRDEFVNLHKDMWNRINELELTEDVLHDECRDLQFLCESHQPSESLLL